MTQDIAAGKGSKNRIVALILAFTLLLAAFLRVHRLGDQPLWIDEISSAEMAGAREPGGLEPPFNRIHDPGINLTGLADQKPLAELPAILATDTHPPLYFYLLRFWREIFGEEDRSIRVISVIASVAGILFLFDAVRILHGSTAMALWSSLIMALATAQIAFAQETRSYAMVSLLLLGAIDIVARIEKLGFTRLRWFLLMMSILLAATTHYLAVPPALALGIYILVRYEKLDRWRALSAMAVAGVLFLVICGPLFWSQRQNFSSNLQWLDDHAPGFEWRFLQRLAVLPVQYLIAPRLVDMKNPVGWIGAVFYVLPLIAIRRRDLSIWILVAGSIIGMTAMSDALHHRSGLESLRFTIPAAPAVYAALVVAAGELPKAWMRHLMPAGIALCCVASLSEAYEQAPKSDLRIMAGNFDAVAGPHDLIVVPFVSRAQNWQEAIALAGLTRYSRYPNRPILILSEPMTAELMAAVRQAPQAWFVASQEDLPFERFVPRGDVAKWRWRPSTGYFGKLEWPAAPPTTSKEPEPSRPPSIPR